MSSTLTTVEALLSQPMLPSLVVKLRKSALKITAGWIAYGLPALALRIYSLAVHGP